MQQAHPLFPVVVTIIVLLFSCSSKKQNDCSEFKTGNFLLHQGLQQEEISYSIHRNDSIQTETNQKTGDITKLSVKWIDKCKYELRFIESTAIYPDSIQKIRKEFVLRSEIIKSTAGYYIFKATNNNANFVSTDTLWLQN